MQKTSPNWKFASVGRAVATNKPREVHMKSALIFANGSPDDGVMVRQVLNHLTPNPYIIAADGGATIARYFGYDPDIIIGDMDSIPPAILDQYQAQGVHIERHPTHKDETDLELALWHAQASGYHFIRVLGAMGGRFDQTLANVSLLASPTLYKTDAVILAGDQAIRLITSGDHAIQGRAGDTISLIPFGGDVLGITTHGLQYPLQSEPLPFATSRGISNVMQAEQATIQIEMGKLLLIHTIGKA